VGADLRDVDRDELFVDQDAADEDDRGQVEQVDQHQLAADAQAPEQARQQLDHRDALAVLPR
jgi:hypothetical protein